MKKLILLAVVIGIFLTGCGYTLQTRANLPFQEIDLGRIENKTAEPKIEDRMTRNLGDVLMEYGFALSPGARYRIEGEVRSFVLTVLSEVSLTAAQYQVTATVGMRLVDTQTGKIVPIENISSPYVTSFSASGRLENILAQKEIATNSALRDLSQRIVQQLVYDKRLFETQPAKTTPAEPPAQPAPAVK
ncbi:MAG TPA: LPS assembly lipoprotein LptE [Dissulfurispiraceae bacterium]|nr:LPS assembly lipoprotein LptE [Dissulfurispiraceae bacterium]